VSVLARRVPECTRYNCNRMYLLDWSLVAYVPFGKVKEPTTHGVTTLMHPALDDTHRSYVFHAGAIRIVRGEGPREQ
jgi:hypothetical protein